MTDDIAIKVEHVSKDFVLPHEKVTSIKSAFMHLARPHKKTRETQHALHDINFEIKKGEFFGIVGRNGSGKSTLLKILAGIYQPTKGRTETHGKLVPFIELGVGFNPELTGRENVFLNGAMLGFSRKEIEAMYDDIVAFAELERFMDQKLKNYSSGMQVRLAFSMATRSEAEILLVDEVLAVGDADFQRKCFDYFKSLKKSDTTVIFVSHSMDAVREYCDRAVLIEASELIMTGSSQKIATEYTRLFTKNETSTSKINTKQRRWGNHAVEIVDPKVTLSDYEKKLTIALSLVAKTGVEPPIVGFLINSPSGAALVGTNTKLENKSLPSMITGQVVDCTFEVDNIFNDGVHAVDLAIIDNDTITICDWWEGAASVRINREVPSPYPIKPIIEINIASKE